MDDLGNCGAISLIFGIILSALGLVLSSTAIRDYFVRLRMYPVWFEINDVGDNTALVLFRLSFVNMSSRGRVVRDIRIKYTKHNAVDAPFVEELDRDHGIVNYRLSNFSRHLPYEEVLLPCLDIPPYQSRSRYWVFGVRYPEAKEPTDLLKRHDILLFQAIGHKFDVVAGCHHQLLFGKTISGAINLYRTR